ncbi:hypothetical protein V1478_005145 [Vespula squamosa]|uniref:Uncharacterized protein n=1 Tax=Vespula squamosa TaxID=30214 RepID=A0ABD2BDA6_VESSQ
MYLPRCNFLLEPSELSTKFLIVITCCLLSIKMFNRQFNLCFHNPYISNFGIKLLIFLPKMKLYLLTLYDPMESLCYLTCRNISYNTSDMTLKGHDFKDFERGNEDRSTINIKYEAGRKKENCEVGYKKDLIVII